MVKVFISHSTKDFHLVTTLSKLLKTYDIEIYIAERDYQPGKLLSQKIMHNIDRSDYFLLVYTINGKDSPFVSQEIGYWIGKRGFNNLIPFVEKGINPKAFLSGIEYIVYNPLRPILAIVDVIKYIKYQIKIKKKQQIFDVSMGLGILGITFLTLYALTKLGEK